jgi:ABC-type nitrate/sulfonate/bicarbonate transport system substrate-binding protein
MTELKFPGLTFWKKSTPLRMGFLPTNDCAPLVVAQELGLFEKYDLEVELRRISHWVHLRDQLADGELDAAHAPATLPFLMDMGVNSKVCRCVTGLILSLQGNAIVLSRKLWSEGVRDASALRQRILQDWEKRTYTFGVMFPYSAQYFLLRRWLRSAGPAVDMRVRIIAVPPAQMYPLLKLGYLDGYCVGEPWTTIAAQAGAGVYAATSAQLAPLHPEKVLIVRETFTEKRAEEHERLIAALLEACALCDKAEFRQQLGGLLAQPHYVNAPPEAFDATPDSPSKPGRRRVSAQVGSSIFFRYGATDPTQEKAAWLASHLNEFLRWNDLRTALDRRTDLTEGVFRPDIYRRGYRLAMDELRQIATGETPLATTPLQSLLRQWRRKKHLFTRRRLATAQTNVKQLAS